MVEVQTRRRGESPAEHKLDPRPESDPTAVPEQDSDLGRQYYYVVPVAAADRGVTR